MTKINLTAGEKVRRLQALLVTVDCKDYLKQRFSTFWDSRTTW